MNHPSFFRGMANLQVDDRDTPVIAHTSLPEYEDDLQTHIHSGNNILFPRSKTWEKRPEHEQWNSRTPFCWKDRKIPAQRKKYRRNRAQHVFGGARQVKLYLYA